MHNAKQYCMSTYCVTQKVVVYLPENSHQVARKSIYLAPITFTSYLINTRTPKV